MAKTKDPERPIRGRRALMPKGYFPGVSGQPHHRTAFGKTVAGQRITPAVLIRPVWRFVASRAASEDVSDLLAGLVRPRVAVGAVYVNVGDSDNLERGIAKLVDLTLRSSLREQGFHLLWAGALPKGSYGSIIFVEDQQPHDRNGFLKRTGEALKKAAESLQEELKGRFKKGVVTVMFMGACLVFTPDADPVHIQCEPQNIQTLQNLIVTAKNPRDINAAVTEYCAPDKASKIHKVLKAFEIGE